MNALAWHPKTHALAYAGDKEDLSKRKREALNLDEDLDAKASRMEEEESGKSWWRYWWFWWQWKCSRSVDGENDRDEIAEEEACR